MSTPNACRREEIVLCQPDNNIPAKPCAKPYAESPECMMITEKQFMRDHTFYSALSSWLFAIAGATNIGVLCAFSSKVLTAAEQGKPIFRSSDPAVIPVIGNKKYNRIALSMTAFGAVCMAVSNWLESKKVVTEWQLGAGKLQRKVDIADKKQEEREVSDPAIAAVDGGGKASAAGSASAPASRSSWAVSTLQQKTPDPVADLANRVR